jgi:AcrR family transcriptional regulator
VASPLHYLDDPEALQRERAAFVDAAMALFAEAGTVELQVAQVVRRAGRHNAAFYRVFGSKEGLVLAVVEESSRRMADVIVRRMQRTKSPEEAVRAWARVLLNLASADLAAGAHAIALDRYRLLNRFPEAAARAAVPLRQPLEQVLRTAGLPQPEVLAEAAFELVLSRQASWIALGHPAGDREIRAYADLVVRLVGL